MTHENAAPLTVTMVDDHDLAVAGLQTLLTPFHSVVYQVFYIARGAIQLLY